MPSFLFSYWQPEIFDGIPWMELKRTQDLTRVEAIIAPKSHSGSILCDHPSQEHISSGALAGSGKELAYLIETGAESNRNCEPLYTGQSGY